jgi:DeoR/GlpR family transcriptional regulator of sugar metabolism
MVGPKKQKRFYLSQKSLEELLAKPHLSIDDIAKRLNTTPDTVRKYIEKYGV